MLSAEIDNADTAEASNRRPHDLSNSVRHREQMSETAASIYTFREMYSGIKLVYKYTSSSIDPMIEEIYQEEFVDFAMDSSSSLELAPKKTLLDEA
ncbi:hypothetical protein Tco_0205058 [Tanacetum coccineum]